jgi:hypothetical protein
MPSLVTMQAASSAHVRVAVAAAGAAVVDVDVDAGALVAGHEFAKHEQSKGLPLTNAEAAHHS